MIKKMILLRISETKKKSIMNIYISKLIEKREELSDKKRGGLVEAATSVWWVGWKAWRESIVGQWAGGDCTLCDFIYQLGWW